MKQKYYTSERNVQIVLSLLKAYGIRKVIASPGTTNVTLVASMQQDSFFEMYSSVDERSAAYMACGMAAESGEPVVLTCTGATASRNYYPGLTEAYYRKLPVVAITATQDLARIGHNIPQVIDRRVCANDITVFSEHIQFIEKASDEWNVTIKVNQAMRALTSRGGGPIHLNLETRYTRDFSVRELPPCRIINYVDAYKEFPALPEGKIAIFIGSHRPMRESLSNAIDRFCATNDAVVFCDHTSNYKGHYRAFNSLVGAQDAYSSSLCACDLLIHIGDVTAAYELMRLGRCSKQQWRVCEDGKTCDTFARLTAVFEMPEEVFFRHYVNEGVEDNDTLATACQKEYEDALLKMPELPFSNLWIASQTAHRLPENSYLHLGILNTIRTWNFYDVPKSVSCFCNTGGFGIDGIVSTLVGSSLANPNKLHFVVVGDLAFFYDLNSMGNRHIGNNVRIMLINNGKGVEFRSPYHFCHQFGEDADKYMAAAGHYGNQSSELIKHYATDLGYEFLSASTKDEYLRAMERFVSPDSLDRPIIFEVFTKTEDENTAIKIAHTLMVEEKTKAVLYVKKLIKKILPIGVIAAIKK